MSVFLLVVLIYVDGSSDVAAYIRPLIEVCESLIPAHKTALQAVSDKHPGKLRMFAMSFVTGEFVDTNNRT